jgi:hypothetical protein
MTTPRRQRLRIWRILIHREPQVSAGYRLLAAEMGIDRDVLVAALLSAVWHRHPDLLRDAALRCAQAVAERPLPSPSRRQASPPRRPAARAPVQPRPRQPQAGAPEESPGDAAATASATPAAPAAPVSADPLPAAQAEASP